MAHFNCLEAPAVGASTARLCDITFETFLSAFSESDVGKPQLIRRVDSDAALPSSDCASRREVRIN